MNTTRISNYIRAFILAFFIIIPSITSAGNDKIEVSIPAVTITNQSFLNYLKQYIIPLAKANNYNKNNDLLYLECRLGANPYTKGKRQYIKLTIIADCYNIREDMLSDEDKNLAETTVDGVTFIVENANSYLFKQKGMRTYRVSSDINLILCEASATWYFVLDDKTFRLYDFRDVNLSWLKNNDLKTFQEQLQYPYKLKQPQLPPVILNKDYKSQLPTQIK